MDLYEGLFGHAEKSRKTIEKEIRSGHSELAVVIRGGKVASFCLFYKSGKRGLFIDYLGVSPLFQRRGMGKKLLQEVFHYCLRFHPRLANVALHCGPDKINFYEKMGFRRSGLFIDHTGSWQIMRAKISETFNN